MEDNLESLIHKIDLLNKYNPVDGLPNSIFYFIGRNTPYINVDLLIKVPGEGVVLTWRDDEYTGKGWHIPGGIIRFREKWDERIKEVAKLELKITGISFDGPCQVSQIITNKIDRSHFISLLFNCTISEKNIKKLKQQVKDNGNKINFFKKSPKNLLKYHSIYKKFIYL
jgi:hypothetical protein